MSYSYILLPKNNICILYFWRPPLGYPVPDLYNNVKQILCILVLFHYLFYIHVFTYFCNFHFSISSFNFPAFFSLKMFPVCNQILIILCYNVTMHFLSVYLYAKDFQSIRLPLWYFNHCSLIYIPLSFLSR